MMPIDDMREEAMTTIQQQIGELARFNESLGDIIRSGYALEGLERWKNRTVKLLTEKVSAKEAKNLYERGKIRGLLTKEERYTRNFHEYLDFLRALLKEVKEHPEDVLCDEENIEIHDNSTLTTKSKTVFIIHGHDETNLLRLEKLLKDRFKLVPIIIRDIPGKGRTIIQKFEEEAKQASFAIALFTPDDMIEVKGSQYTQARPNVIFELGWFYGQLGRDKTCILFKKGTQIHSDLDGINRIEFTTSIQESYLEIERELQAAGIV